MPLSGYCRAIRTVAIRSNVIQLFSFSFFFLAAQGALPICSWGMQVLYNFSCWSPNGPQDQICASAQSPPDGKRARRCRAADGRAASNGHPFHAPAPGGPPRSSVPFPSAAAAAASGKRRATAKKAPCGPSLQDAASSSSSGSRQDSGSVGDGRR